MKVEIKGSELWIDNQNLGSFEKFKKSYPEMECGKCYKIHTKEGVIHVGMVKSIVKTIDGTTILFDQDWLSNIPNYFMGVEDITKFEQINKEDVTTFIYQTNPTKVVITLEAGNDMFYDLDQRELSVTDYINFKNDLQKIYEKYGKNI